jgi:hypothetical protein
VSESSHFVFFIVNKAKHEAYAFKIFAKERKHEYYHELGALETVSDSRYVLKHIETCDYNKCPIIPPLTFPESSVFSAEIFTREYAYLAFPLLANGSLLDILTIR